MPLHQSQMDEGGGGRGACQKKGNMKYKSTYLKTLTLSTPVATVPIVWTKNVGTGNKHYLAKRPGFPLCHPL